jgi:neutral ceramidase
MSHNEFNRRQLLKLGLASGAYFAAAMPGESLWGSARADGSPSILVGTAKVDMTPTLPSPFDIGVLEVADTVCQRLFARMVYFESGDQRMLMIATDTAGILHTAYHTFRRAIAQKTGLSPGQIVINASHTHRGLYYNLDDQALLDKTPFQLVGMDSFNALVPRLAEGAKQAMANKRPAKLSVGQGQLPELAWNRRLLYLSEYHERRFNKRRKYPIGTTDPALGVVKCEGADGKALAVLCFYACHPTVAEPGLSGDYPGYAMAALERELGPSCTALFFQGCAGNIAPNYRLQGPGGTTAAVDMVGSLFAARVEHTLLNSMTKIDSASFLFGRAEYDLPLIPLSYGPTDVGSVDLGRWFQPPPLVSERQEGSIKDLEERFEKAVASFDRSLLTSSPRNTSGSYQHWLMMALADRLTLAKNLKEWSRHEVQVLVCGPLCLVFIPGETYIDYGLEIKQNSPYRYTFVSAYNDTTITYVPDPIAFEEGGYETGPWNYSTPETGGVMVTESLKLIKSLPRPG